MKTMIKTLSLCFVLFSAGIVQGVEWYEEGEGGYATSNGNIVPWNASSFLNTNSVTYAILEDGSPIGDEGDLLGAFYDGELRGVIGTYSVPFGPYAGSNLFLLYMYSNSSGSEDFNFKFYDASSGAVSDLPETYTFIADDPQGSLTAPESLTYVAPSGGDSGGDDGGAAGNGYVDNSGWNQEGEGGFAYSNGNMVPANAASFLNTNSVTYAIQEDGLTIGDEGDLLGAFYDGELRGIIGTYAVPFGPYAGSNLFLLYMYSNASGSELFNFKFYDASSGLTYDLDHTYTFIADDPQGSLTAPVAITVELDEETGCASGVYDCLGVCDGSAAEDCLGVCGGAAVEDCAGLCAGTSVADECGVCDGSGPADNFDCEGNCTATVDCAGTCAGSATEDNCGTCDVDSSNDCEADCAGQFGGTATIDECGTCDSDPSNDCTQDCAGVWGGDSWVSDCGCVAAGNSGDDCDDCAGDPDGSALADDCGVCSGGSTGHDANSDQDDCGVCFGDDSSCTGCTDSSAVNYDFTATIACDDCCSYASFAFNQSMIQAAYFFSNVTIDGVAAVIGEDEIYGFNGDICVGGGTWSGSNIEIMLMGADGLDFTTGYLADGDIPTFKVVDTSTGLSYDAVFNGVQGAFGDCADTGPADDLNGGGYPGDQVSSLNGTDVEFATCTTFPAFASFGAYWDLGTADAVQDCNGLVGGKAYYDDCSDCVYATSHNINDPDNDTVCNDGAFNGEADNCPDTANGPNEGADADGDSSGDQWNYDGDEQGDACDPDDDNDGALDDDDSSDNDAYICSDTDDDGCEDCLGGTYDTFADGPDHESDGDCDSHDTDDDNDGIADEADACHFGDLDWTSTSDTDHDTDGCQDASDEDGDDDNDSQADADDACQTGDLGWTSDDETDYDDDGCQDASTEDLDDDNDAIADDVDACHFGDLDWTSTSDTDHDTDGCQDASTEDLDDDNDAIADDVDSCQTGDLDWTSTSDTDHDTDGCQDASDEDGDDDNDSQADADDACQTGDLGWTSDASTDHDDDGCQDASDEDQDNDNDGVEDEVDSCETGNLGWISDASTDHDSDGCQDASDEDPDDDNDGMDDEPDACQTGDLGWTSNAVTDHDTDGCQDDGEDQDDDNDSQSDDTDDCDPDSSGAGTGDLDWTSNDTTDYDDDGCQDASDEDPDDDNDDILDDFDDCHFGLNPNVFISTDSDGDNLIGTDHDSDGCEDDSDEDQDDDNDFLGDAADNCDPDSGQASDLDWISTGDSDHDTDGCQDTSDEDGDDDNDGVADEDDDCPTGDLGWTSSGVDGENTDYDGDGCQDDSTEDTDDDNDGALDDNDADDNNIYVCSDNDEDGCEDCDSGSYDTSNDGLDADGDGMCDIGDVDLSLHAGANSVSFYALPSSGDYSVSNIFGDDGNIAKVFGEGVIAYQHSTSGWVGALTDVENTDGYWTILNEDQTLQVSGFPTGAVEYAVHTGNNFLSYSYSQAQSLDSALPTNASDNTMYVYGEGVSAVQVEGMWVGTLSQTGLEGGTGYWFGASDNFVFQYNAPNTGLGRFVAKTMPRVPESLSYNQSTEQYFYFIKEANIGNVELGYGDWIVAYNGDVVVGARQYEPGMIVDVPIMGSFPNMDLPELANLTAGYCQPGDVPTIKIHRTTGEVVDMHVTLVDGSLAFSGMGHAMVTLSDNLIPMEVSLHNAYPNPFNPSTMIEYVIPEGSMQVNLSVYDLRGRLVSELVNEIQVGAIDPYKVVWNADMNASGVYFVRLTAGNTVKNQKIMLVK